MTLPAQPACPPPSLNPDAAAVERLYYGRRHRMAFRAGTYLALIRMMGVGHLVATLYGHTRLVSETHARLARTRQTLRDLVCHGFDSPQGVEAVRRLREAHKPLKNVTPDDYRYVLATFFLEPLRWSERHASHQLTPQELDLVLAFWGRVGHEMGMTGLPTSLPAWKALQQGYEARHMRHTPEGQQVAAMCLRDVVKLSVPKPLQWIFRQTMVATMEPAVRETLRIPAARPAARLLVAALLKATA